jgi:hypothetical protein
MTLPEFLKALSATTKKWRWYNTSYNKFSPSGIRATLRRGIDKLDSIHCPIQIVGYERAASDIYTHLVAKNLGLSRLTTSRIMDAADGQQNNLRTRIMKAVGLLKP